MRLSDLKGAFDRLTGWARFFILGILGVIASLGQAPFGWPVLSVTGFAIVFLLLPENTRPARLFRLGWNFALGYFALCLQWLVSPFLVEPEIYGWMAPFAIVFMASGLALFWGAAFALTARSGRWALVLTLPIAEILRAYLFGGFPWGMPAYGLVDSLLGQGAAFVGSHGLNVALLLIAFGLTCKFKTQPVLVLGTFVGLGLVLVPAPAPMEAPKGAGVLRLVQPNAPQHLKWHRDHIGRFFESSLAATSAVGEVDLILWPETSLPAALNYAESAVRQITDAAQGVPVLVGANRFDGPRLLNSAILIDEAGQVSDVYDKHHLVPFGEYVPFGDVLARWGIHGLAASEGQGFSAGEGPASMDLGTLGKALMLICYEAVFPQDLRIAERPDFLLQITNDAWFGTFSGPYQHLVQAQMRAVEQGLPMVRVGNTGVSAMIDARGRIVSFIPLNETGHLDVSLHSALPKTLYAKTGDWPLLLILSLLFLGHLALSRSKPVDRRTRGL